MADSPNIPWRERALNAEDLLIHFLVFARENPEGGFSVPSYLVGEIEGLVPSWRERTARTARRSRQADILAGVETGYEPSDGCPNCGEDLPVCQKTESERVELVICSSCQEEVPVEVAADFALWSAANKS
jgi:hypothetical protein